MDWAKITARRDEKDSSLGFGAAYITDLTVCVYVCDVRFGVGPAKLRLHPFILIILLYIYLVARFDPVDTDGTVDPAVKSQLPH